VSAAEIYEKIKAEFERLERNGAAPAEWIPFANRLVEAVMKIQAIVMDHQKRLIAQTRGDLDRADYETTRQAAKDGIQILDNLTALHERTRSKLRMQ